jgi:hypothetical protein
MPFSEVLAYRNIGFSPEFRKIEAPCPASAGLKRGRESSTVRNSIIFLIRLLTPQQAAGNALAVAVQVISYIPPV